MKQTSISTQPINKKQLPDYIRKHKDMLLPMFQHRSSRCSDENPYNGFDTKDGVCRCSRCAIISMCEYEVDIDNWNFEFEIFATVKKGEKL